MHASKLVWFVMPRIARPTILLLVLVSGCRPRSEDVAGASNVTTYAGEAGAVTSFSDHDSLEPASVSGPIAVDFPLGALPPEQRQLAELSTILAFREFHRSFPPAPEWEWIPNPPEPPPEQFALHNKVGHVRMVNVFGEWITMVELFGAKDYSRRVDEVLNFRWTTPFGLQFDNPPSESVLATFQEKGPERLVHIAVRCHGLSEEGCRILSELPHVKSIDVPGRDWDHGPVWHFPTLVGYGRLPVAVDQPSRFGHRTTVGQRHRRVGRELLPRRCGRTAIRAITVSTHGEGLPPGCVHRVATVESGRIRIETPRSGSLAISAAMPARFPVAEFRGDKSKVDGGVYGRVVAWGVSAHGQPLKDRKSLLLRDAIPLTLGLGNSGD